MNGTVRLLQNYAASHEFFVLISLSTSWPHRPVTIILPLLAYFPLKKEDEEKPLVFSLHHSYGWTMISYLLVLGYRWYLEVEHCDSRVHFIGQIFGHAYKCKVMLSIFLD